MCIFQVTNPAIDPLREGLVMSLEVNIGKRGNILEVGPENVSQVHSHFHCLGFSDTFLSDYQLPLTSLLVLVLFIAF